MLTPKTGLANKYLRFLFAAFIFVSCLFIGQPAEATSASGLTQSVYTYSEGSTPDRKEYTLCNTSVVANINFDVGGDVVANCQSDFVIIHWTGYITMPIDGPVTFQSLADDGFYMDIGGNVVIDDWVLKGCSGSTGTHTFESGVSQKLDIWWYEYGGGACNFLYYTDPVTAFTLVPDSAFTTDAVPVVVPPFLNAPVNVQTSVFENTIKVTWDAPEDTGTAIERYALSWTYDGQPGWGVGVSGNESTISNLPENKEITIWVRSDNDTLGVYSQSSTPVTATTGTIFVPPVDPPVEPVDPPVEPVEPPVIEPEPIEPPVVEPEPELPPVVPVEQPNPEPEPQPEPEEGSKEIPVVIENLMELNLESVDPTELTEAQAEQLVEAALLVFETAVEGSPEYEQALDALYLAAEQDDIVVDEELANAPVIGAAIVGLTNAINFLGNIGSDISPEVREESKKIVVGAIVVGQIAQLSAATSLSKLSRNGK